MNKRPIIKANERYNYLTTIKRIENSKHGCVQWLCICDCGKERIVKSYVLYNKKIKDCGCDIEKRKKYDSEVNAKRILYNSYKDGEKAKIVGFDISEEDFFKITKVNCFYCNTAPFAVKRNHSRNWKSAYVYNGLDRIDNKKGYFLSNIRPCCKWCNFTKKDMSEKDFIAWIKKIGNNLIKSEHPLIKEVYNKIKGMKE
jgi:hypothetical protein